MLAKKYRLNLSLEENSSIFERNNSFLLSSNYFLLYFRVNNSHLMVSCLTPKKVFPKATERNKHRRLLYSILQEFIEKEELALSNKLDLVIVYKKAFLEISNQDNKNLLRDDLSKIIKELKNKTKNVEVL